MSLASQARTRRLGDASCYWKVALFSTFRLLWDFNFILLSPSSITATLGLQLHINFVLFLLYILWSLMDGKKHWSTSYAIYIVKETLYSIGKRNYYS